jgi:hypothetical protein
MLQGVLLTKEEIALKEDDPFCLLYFKNSRISQLFAELEYCLVSAFSQSKKLTGTFVVSAGERPHCGQTLTAGSETHNFLGKHKEE